MSDLSSGTGATDAPLAKVAAALAAATVLVLVVLNIIGADGPIWTLQAVLALATIVAAWKAGGTSPRNTLAFVSLLVGVVLLLMFLGFLLAEA